MTRGKNLAVARLRPHHCLHRGTTAEDDDIVGQARAQAANQSTMSTGFKA
jgi:hypothetical protein